MTAFPRLLAFAPTLDLSTLSEELAHVTTPLPFWWRDDDVIEPTRALDDLLAFAARHGAPLALAAIPADLQPTLAPRLEPLAAAGRVEILPHGWAHASHAPRAEKKTEFGPHRPLDLRLSDARRGLDRLEAAFGPAVTPLFTPPWNRIAEDMIPHLAVVGLTGVSTFRSRTGPIAAPGVARVNTHLDPIAWRGNRGLAPPQAIVNALVALLAARRRGVADATEPIGLLTHHLVHDVDINGFLDALLTDLGAASRLQWVSARAAMDAALRRAA